MQYAVRDGLTYTGKLHYQQKNINFVSLTTSTHLNTHFLGLFCEILRANAHENH